MAKKEETTAGIGFFGLLGLLFIALKLLEVSVVAGWSWWLVLLPLYGPIALVFALLVPILIYVALKK